MRITVQAQRPILRLAPACMPQLRRTMLKNPPFALDAVRIERALLLGLISKGLTGLGGLQLCWDELHAVSRELRLESVNAAARSCQQALCLKQRAPRDLLLRAKPPAGA